MANQSWQDVINFTMNRGDLAVLQKVVNHLDTGGSLKDRIQLTTDLKAIVNDMEIAMRGKHG